MIDSVSNIALKLLIVFSLVMPSLGVAKDINQDDAIALRQQGVILPLEQILQAAQRLRPGRVIKVELEKSVTSIYMRLKSQTTKARSGR